MCHLCRQKGKPQEEKLTDGILQQETEEAGERVRRWSFVVEKRLNIRMTPEKG
jgi:hypothetical protein